MAAAPSSAINLAVQPGDSSGEDEEHSMPREEEQRARWSEAELVILDKYLPRYKAKTKAQRKVLLSVKVLPKMKEVFTDTDWTRRKQVGCFIMHDQIFS